MDHKNDTPKPPADVPASITNELVDLNPGQLRKTAEFIQDLLNQQPPVSEEIEADEGEEIVRITEEDGYTIVVKRQPCTTGCEDCPHGPYLYHVQRERHSDGEESLHWSYIGRVVE